MANIQLCGISDEAGPDIQTQIRAHKELGWNLMELRMVNKKNITDISDNDFDEVHSAVTEAGMSVPDFGSQLCNWARPITSDFQADVGDLKRAIPRMQRLGTKNIRIMSYPNDEKSPLPENEWRKEAVRRISELVKMAEDGGVVLLHENCHGWASQSPQTMLALLEEIPSPSLGLLYDTGNFSGKPGDESSWEMYKGIRDKISFVHMKDTNESGNCFAGEGNCQIPRIVEDLVKTGYEGVISIEPHVSAVVHTGADAPPEVLYETYTKYGRMAKEILMKAMG